MEADADAVAQLHRLSVRTAMPWLPDLHTPEEDRSFFAEELRISRGWVVEEAGDLAGFAVLRDGWLRHLYVDPAHQGQGIGSALLDAALSASPVLQLWAFQRNTRAREFYRARGFVEVEWTDGAGNEEREPDVRMQRG